ncbi:MAG: twin-arginine translocase subunit TatB [Deltaproteobacteria bacterium HGW-Deltaproteobacteria-18]|jgi:sec-independent protein translocase protein TatB|nr:MAG: twin-arginine translocase subunit TatB [Deltaproteobacteria bacterium HGW-Deltaproteobacteria-18]
MFGIGSTELIVILIVALIVIGPAKLPEMAKSLGKALGEFRRVSTDVKRTIEMEAEQSEQKVKTEQAKKELYPETVAKAPAEPEATAVPAEPEATEAAAPEQPSVQSAEKEKDKA